MTTENDQLKRASELRAALETIESMLDADGYELSISQVDENSIRLAIDARPDACDDCLVPKPVMSGIVESTLEAAGLPGLEIELVYPTDQSG